MEYLQNALSGQFELKQAAGLDLNTQNSKMKILQVRLD
jgi:hypothetical protein